MSVNETVVTVSYDRKFSDGNYGSEGMSLSWTVTYEDETDEACNSEVVEARCTEIAAKLRIAVLSELSKSGSRAVAQSAAYELAPASKPSNYAGEDLEEIPF